MKILVQDKREKAESRKQKAESKKQKAKSTNQLFSYSVIQLLSYSNKQINK